MPETRGASCEISACSRPELTEVAPTAGRESSPLLDDDDDWHPILLHHRHAPATINASPARSGRRHGLPHPRPRPPDTPGTRTGCMRSRVRARSRGGSTLAVLSVLSHLNADKCWLVASLGGVQEARAVALELEAEGFST